MTIDALIFDLSGTLVRMRPPTLLGDKSSLIKLSTKYSLAIVTGGPKTETVNILKSLDIYSLFSVVITKYDSSLRKPDPQLLYLAVKQCQYKNPIYIGDTLKDYKMAKSANIPFIYIGKKKIGDAQISSLNELPLLLSSERII